VPPSSSYKAITVFCSNGFFYGVNPELGLIRNYQKADNKLSSSGAGCATRGL